MAAAISSIVASTLSSWSLKAGDTGRESGYSVPRLFEVIFSKFLVNSSVVKVAKKLLGLNLPNIYSSIC